MVNQIAAAATEQSSATDEVNGNVNEIARISLEASSSARQSAKACVALLSDWFPATTGEMVHVDGGFHAVGA